MQAEDFEPTGTFEVIKVLGRELQSSKERIKQLEAALAETSSPSYPDAKEIAARSKRAEDQAVKLKDDLLNAENLNAKLKINLDRLQARIEKMSPLKQEPMETSESALRDRVQTANIRVLELENRLKRESQDKAELKRKVASLETEALLMKDRLKKYEAVQAATAATADNNQSKISHKAWTIENYIDFSRGLPKAPNRPDYVSLLPIYDATRNLRSYLEADPALNGFSQNIICLPSPSRLVWASTSCQVGLAFGTVYQYHGKREEWERHSEYHHRYGKEFELFLKNGDYTYYAGRYMCEDIRAQNPHGCIGLDPESVKALTEATLFSRVENRDIVAKMIGSLYTQGILKAECAILRCVGFNHKVQDILSARYSILRNLEPKRPVDGTMTKGGGPHGSNNLKKARRN